MLRVSLNLKKTIVIFEIRTLEFFNMRFFMQKYKILTFRTKNALVGGIFRLEFKKASHICNQCPQISLSAKFVAKQKCLNLGPKMPDLDILGLEVENNLEFV